MEEFRLNNAIESESKTSTLVKGGRQKRMIQKLPLEVETDTSRLLADKT